MSKTFEDNTQKVLTMTSALKQKLNLVEGLGIKEEDLNALEIEAQKAIEMSQDVDALRAEVTEKLKKANEQLEAVKKKGMVYRKLIKDNFPQERWFNFGIMDKR